MTPQEMVDALSRCTPTQFSQVLSRMGLVREHAPSPHLMLRQRALELVHLAQKHDPPGLTALEVAIKEMQLQQSEVPKVKLLPDPKLHIPERTILFLSANPMQTSQLAIDTEFISIQEELKEAGVANSIHLEIQKAVTTDDLTKYLRQTKPTVVHFSAHGSPDGEIVLTDSTQAEKMLVNGDTLAELFQLLSTEGPECVVLNACYSEALAEKICCSVKFVVGMNREIGDEDALKFSLGFYRAMAYGDDYLKCFKWACNQIQLSGLPDFAVPRLKTQTETIAFTPKVPGDRLHETEENDCGVDTVRPVRTFSLFESQSEDLPTDISDELQKEKKVPLWFGTNRKPIIANNQLIRYGDEVDDHIHYGHCYVGIPKYHRIGSPNDGVWASFVRFIKLLVTTNNRTQEPCLLDQQELTRKDFYKSTQKHLNQLEPTQKHGLIFIHGYNVNFEEAATQAAQLCMDINIPCAAAFFSWPSMGRLDTYMVDEERIVASEMHLTEFLHDFARYSGAERIHVIAHSMGNRGLLRALMALAHNEESRLFDNVVLAAPDLNSHLFRHNANAYRKTSARTTMYVSQKDRALALSHALHDNIRAGFAPPFTIVKGVDTIDSTFVDLSYLGHGYFAGARPILADIYYLLAHNHAPNDRFGIERANGEEPSYWQFKP